MNSTAYSLSPHGDSLAYLECSNCNRKTYVNKEYMDALGLLQLTPRFLPVLFCFQCDKRASMETMKSEEKR